MPIMYEILIHKVINEKDSHLSYILDEKEPLKIQNKKVGCTHAYIKDGLGLLSTIKITDKECMYCTIFSSGIHFYE